MRVHRLRIRGFGPFAGTEHIDFDDLSGAGLFLLCGPTGAGKTSILDAICFALYGDVPGDRGTAKRLRSDHAAPDVAPEVALEATLRGRRFRITRSPAWVRPKRRGTGTTTQQAHVTIEERTVGGWLALSNRLDETGQLVSELLGMNLTQFCQVALLPQGRFQAFLRARSDDRHRVLQQLFRTNRFEDVERWLVDRRQALAQRDRDHRTAVAEVLNRLSECSGVPLPSDCDAPGLDGPGNAALVEEWAGELVESAARHAATLDRARRTGEAALASATDVLQRAREAARLRERHREAVAADVALRNSAPEAENDRLRLDAGRRARAVAPLLRMLDEARTAERTARHAVAEVLRAASERLETELQLVTAETLATAEGDARATAAVARALLPRERELRAAESRHRDSVAALAELAQQAAELERQCADLPPRIRATRERREQLLRTAAAGPAAEEAERGLLAALEAAERLVATRAELAVAEDELRASVDRAQELRERVHAVREARINGMAAELAAALGAGEACPVCGSAEHPLVAARHDGAPGPAEEDRARQAFEDADFERQARSERVGSLRRSCALAEQASGGATVEQLQQRLGAVHEERSRVDEAGAAAERLAAELSRLEELLDETHGALLRTRSEAGRQEAGRAGAAATIDTVTTELADLFAGRDVTGGVDELHRSSTEAGAVFARARAALDRRDQTRQHLENCQDRAAATARQHGFSNASEAAAAVLDRAECDPIEDPLRARERDAARITAVLDDPAVQAALGEQGPDVPTLAARHRRLEHRHAATLAGLRMVADRATRLTELAADLGDRLAAWHPVREAHALAQSLSSFVEGRSPDNSLRIRLSAYVLASRLRQVVAAANERLRAMSDDRYLLEHAEARGAGEQRGGLSLVVRDAWTGESRDPATLSGGETFVASLALALGLADVVTQEAGGSDIDTLFIDEGFGSLDPETLDDVMCTLDTLREGGRVVGLVSHVPELRSRVPAQLQVHKGRSGSSVASLRDLV